MTDHTPETLEGLPTSDLVDLAAAAGTGTPSVIFNHGDASVRAFCCAAVLEGDVEKAIAAGIAAHVPAETSGGLGVRAAVDKGPAPGPGVPPRSITVDLDEATDRLALRLDNAFDRLEEMVGQLERIVSQVDRLLGSPDVGRDVVDDVVVGTPLSDEAAALAGEADGGAQESGEEAEAEE